MLNHDVREELILGEGDDPDVISTEQYLGPDFWNDVKQAQEDFQFRLNGLTPVASIPEALVNKWIREGFDFWQASSRDIQDKLRAEENTAFILSGDKTF